MCETVAQRLSAMTVGRLESPSLWVRGSGAAQLMVLLSSHVADKSVLPGSVRPQLLATGTAPQGCSGSPGHETWWLSPARLPPASVDDPGAGWQRRCL